LVDDIPDHPNCGNSQLSGNTNLACLCLDYVCLIL